MRPAVDEKGGFITTTVGFTSSGRMLFDLLGVLGEHLRVRQDLAQHRGAARRQLVQHDVGAGQLAEHREPPAGGRLEVVSPGFTLATQFAM
jgi:hypothetical protein